MIVDTPSCIDWRALFAELAGVLGISVDRFILHSYVFLVCVCVFEFVCLFVCVCLYWVLCA